MKGMVIGKLPPVKLPPSRKIALKKFPPCLGLRFGLGLGS